jgi:outer membrane protein assembly factor BamB
VQIDGASHETVPLARSWSAGGPPVLWSVELGEGYAGAAVRAGRVYVLDYDQRQRDDVLRCLSLADGKEIWRRAYPVKVKRNHGMSRTVPAVSENYVVSLGPKCHVLCVDAVTGAFKWGIDLVRQYRAKVPPWYAGQCPLIDGDRAIIAPGGTALMIAVDCATGKVLWRTPNPDNRSMSHSSIMPMTFNGKRMYVYTAVGGVVGVSANDGRILWKTDQWQIKIATIPTPIPLSGGRIFLTGGYNAGSMMLQLKAQGDSISATPLFRLTPDQFGSGQQTPILYGDHIYGVIPDGKLACIDLNGNTRWTSGNTKRFGLGPYTIADGMIYLMNDTGLMTLVEATPTGYHQLAEAQVLIGHDSWAPLALAGGRLIARDLTRMVCLDVRRK